jgi:UDP-glucose 4-epimerase|tara:strand:- start:606 stop:1577 length:972 start_codon:yes stop_codon:yes gene_type:complete
LKKILIIGACGYLGARLSKYLAEKGCGVTAFDSYNPSHYKEWTSLMDEVIVGDIRDENTISDLVNINIDVVIHLISLDHHKSEDDPNFVSSINVMPTWSLLDEFTKNGLKKFIYFSTIHVYGNLPKTIIREGQAPKPINAYGLTHLLSENICNYYNEKTETECINIRLSNSYGRPVFSENNCWWLAINDFCRTALGKSEIKLLSDGSPQRDFIYSTDVCRAVEIIINAENKNLQENIFHISSGNTYSILEIAYFIKDIYEGRYQEELNIILPEKTTLLSPDEFSKKEKFLIDNEKIRSLGFVPKTELKTGVNKVFDYLDKTHE